MSTQSWPICDDELFHWRFHDLAISIQSYVYSMAFYNDLPTTVQCNFDADQLFERLRILAA
jgi:hypothetical protein